MLEHLRILRVSGADAQAFLHGQFCNTLPTEHGQLRLNAWCNPKGRVIGTFLIARSDDSIPCFDLILPTALATELKTRLQRYVLRSKLDINDTSHQAQIGTQSNGAPLPYDSKRRLAIIETGKAHSEKNPASENDWLLDDLRAGMPWLNPENSERFLPQELNMDLMSGLSLKKGCYPGQEIIARLHYRGKVKRRLLLAETPWEGTLPTSLEKLQGASAGNGELLACAVDEQTKRLYMQWVVDPQCVHQGEWSTHSLPMLKFELHPPRYAAVAFSE
ncbi:MAG: CAF17-like 4Fe-4S cluster assembly/insertion protein YgfZ [Candidatus Eutrophobiaceae bacterium]